MRILLMLAIMAFANCKNSKTAAVQPSAAPEGSKVVSDSLPVCVTALIEKFKSEDVTNPPMKIYRYVYKGKQVYYVPGPCCDNFSNLYNDSCRIMGHPDGGFTGRGDGQFPDFRKEISEEKLLWEDPRGGKGN